jgi:DNA ligase-1
MQDCYKDYIHHQSFPILYGTEKNGKTKTWSASVFKHSSSGASSDGVSLRASEDKALSVIEFGQIDGKKQTATREYTEGKNIGKKNETTPLQQCINETLKKWKDKKEKESYKEKNNSIEEKEENSNNNEEKEEKYFPMLAQTYEPNTKKNKKNDIAFPCFVQPKLDGLRCIMYSSNEKIRCQSRTGTFFDSLTHITNELETFYKHNKVILDGELYTTSIPFEELAGLIKKKKLTEEDKEKIKIVKYHVYDIINDKTYENRLNDINSYIKNFQYAVKVPTYHVENFSQFKDYFSQFIQTGYEGIMLRNVNGLYRCNYRSHDLQKYKEFLESEYTISSFKEGDGRDKGTVIWVCQTEDGKEFSVRPRGTIEKRKEWYNNGQKYLGKKLTVIYQELSEMGIPRFPVGKDVRDDY